MTRVAVLSGGPSLEHEVSLRSGRRVVDALRSRGHEVVAFDLDDALAKHLVEGGFEAAFLALHGRAGEDGTVQNLLELLDVPYTGPDAIASSLAWDKGVAKGIWLRSGLPTPDWMAVSSTAVRELGAAVWLERLVQRLGLPLVVKPGQGGSSLGVQVVHSAEELTPALLAAFSYHDVVLAERFVAGTEVAVSILDGKALPPVEIAPHDGSYDYAARYTAGSTGFFAPARLPGEVLARCADVALAAYERLGCRHLTRADLIVDPGATPFLLELDTCPGMTETSLFPIAVEAAGLDFAAVCDRLLALALA